MKAGPAKCGIIGDCQEVLLCAALSESSMIKLDKAGKIAGSQRSKTLDISSRNTKPWKGGTSSTITRAAASGFYLNPSDVPDHIKVCERI
jgi:hypothetical protein